MCAPTGTAIPIAPLQLAADLVHEGLLPRQQEYVLRLNTEGVIHETAMEITSVQKGSWIIVFSILWEKVVVPVAGGVSLALVKEALKGSKLEARIKDWRPKLAAVDILRKVFGGATKKKEAGRGINAYRLMVDRNVAAPVAADLSGLTLKRVEPFDSSSWSSSARAYFD
jgi:hypothetical protein